MNFRFTQKKWSSKLWSSVLLKKNEVRNYEVPIYSKKMKCEIMNFRFTQKKWSAKIWTSALLLLKWSCQKWTLFTQNYELLLFSGSLLKRFPKRERMMVLMFLLKSFQGEPRGSVVFVLNSIVKLFVANNWTQTSKHFFWVCVLNRLPKR